MLVQDRPGDPRCTVRLPAGAALATSSTAGAHLGPPGRAAAPHPRPAHRPARASRSGGRVSVAAYSCLRANTLSTAAIVRGHGAPDLLAAYPARLVTPDLDVLRLGGWPS